MILTEQDCLLALHLAFPFAPAKAYQLFMQRELVDRAIAPILEENLLEKTRKAAGELGIDIVDYLDPAYPEGLKKLPDPPLVIYRKGLPIKGPSAAIVGTRACSIYGQSMAKQIASVCAQQEITIVSGLARGIDTAAHIGALETGTTVAVIGSGLAHIYPKENAHLAKQISEKGALYSEYPIFTPPDRFQFPRRNRLIAAMSDGSLLIEAPIKSGAMGTLEWASKLNKLCFALPGRADAETFRGNHFLIKEGKAKLVENGAEMVSLLRPGLFRQTEKKDLNADLSAAERQLLLQFPSSEISFDELATQSRLPIPALNALLVGLSIKKIIREYPGKLYKKVV